MSIPESVEELLGPVVANLGVELIDVEYNGGVLRLVIDEEGGVNTDTLAKVNRLVSPMLDEHDPISARYTLEVSSPGVERKLTRPGHFERAVDETVVVKMAPGIEPRRVKGRLVGATENDFVVDVIEIDGVDQAEADQHTIAYDDVTKARTVFDFGPTPKKGGKPGSKKKQAAKKQAAKAAAKGKKSGAKQRPNQSNNKQGSSKDEHSEGEAS